MPSRPESGSNAGTAGNFMKMRVIDRAKKTDRQYNKYNELRIPKMISQGEVVPLHK